MAILLLLAAVVHPVIHLGHESPLCPCVHGATVAVEQPQLIANEPRRLTFVPALQQGIRTVANAEVPARAPPAA